MKPFKTICLLIAISLTSTSYGQFLDKLGKKAERAVERTVERRVERETEKSTDRALDSVVDAPKKTKKEKRKKSKKKQKSNNVIGGDPDPEVVAVESNESEATVNATFDFQSGNQIVFADSFSQDNYGDFPAKWDANGSGELININGEKWFRLGNKTTFIPMTSSSLPDNFTIEFDLLTKGMDNKTSSQAMITLLLTSSNNFEKGKNWSMVELSPCQYIDSPGAIERVENGKRVFRNEIEKDYRSAIRNKSKVSIAVNKSRMRVWINQNKIVDVPRLVAKGITNFMITTRGLRDPRDVDEVFISNFKIAKTGVDNRSKLLTEGKLSTNTILFNTGSATIKNSSNPIIDEVADAMKSSQEIIIKIIGHTDSDGDESSNFKLSYERAEAVKQILTSQHGISASRIMTEGKGESTPITSNSNAEGKSKNRRVEFIKL
jgi:outer membrane protein OmpA-like peptidoglycan-associated protein